MKKYALTGASIAHSRSPQLFAAGYPHSKEYSYELLPASSAEEAIRLFKVHRLAGMNVTAPLKMDILNYTDTQSEEVQITGAANTILWHAGKLCAYNTDVHGVIAAFENTGHPVTQTTAMVLGAGGAGRAAVYALRKAGTKVYWVNRTFSKVKVPAACDAIPLSVSDMDAGVADSQLIVNTLPHYAECLKDLQLRRSHVVLDADYATPPLREAAIAAGATYISGVWWLLHQAIPAYTLFTGHVPDITAMKQCCI